MHNTSSSQLWEAGLYTNNTSSHHSTQHHHHHPQATTVCLKLKLVAQANTVTGYIRSQQSNQVWLGVR